MPNQQDVLIRPRLSERPLYPFNVNGPDREVRAEEVVSYGGFPFAMTDDGWVLVEHVDLGD